MWHCNFLDCAAASDHDRPTRRVVCTSPSFTFTSPRLLLPSADPPFHLPTFLVLSRVNKTCTRNRTLRYLRPTRSSPLADPTTTTSTRTPRHVSLLLLPATASATAAAIAKILLVLNKSCAAAHRHLNLLSHSSSLASGSTSLQRVYPRNLAVHSLTTSTLYVE